MAQFGGLWNEDDLKSDVVRFKIDIKKNQKKRKSF